MRGREGAALREFFTRFQPLLMREGYSMRVRVAARDEMVTQCLDDAAIALMRHTTPVPRSLAGYLLTAFRHDVINARRDETQRHVRSRTAVREGSAAGEWVVPEASSEYALRASHGPAHHDDALTPVLAGMATALTKGLSDDERRLLTWVGHWVPQRVIARWLGISYGAVRARVLRLRGRLRAAAACYAGGLTADEQRVLQRFFRRISSPPALRGPGAMRASPIDPLPIVTGERTSAGD